MPWILLSLFVFAWGLTPVKTFLNGGPIGHPNFLGGVSSISIADALDSAFFVRIRLGTHAGENLSERWTHRPSQLPRRCFLHQHRGCPGFCFLCSYSPGDSRR